MTLQTIIVLGAVVISAVYLFRAIRAPLKGRRRCGSACSTCNAECSKREKSE